MNSRIEILPTQIEDLAFVYSLFERSILYQEQNGYPVWRNYDKGAIVKDIENGNQYKITVDGKPAMIFSVAYSDKIIWRERDLNDAIYLHRIVINPEFKGQKLFGVIVDWSLQQAKVKGLEFVRMDTWASNTNIIDYYKTFRFEVVEHYTTPDTPALPIHNRNLALTLMQYRG